MRRPVVLLSATAQTGRFVRNRRNAFMDVGPRRCGPVAYDTDGTMDRSRLLVRWLMLPGAGLCLVGLLGLTWPGRPIPLHQATSVGTAVELDGQVRHMTLAPSRPAARSEKHSASGTGAVRATAYADGEPVDRELSWPPGGAPHEVSEAGSPRLLAPQLEPPLVLAPVAPKPAPLAPPADVSMPVIQPAEPAPSDLAEAKPEVFAEPPRAEPMQRAPAARSRQLEALAQEADAHSRQGYQLAGRRAYYAARREFLTALRLMAQGLDMEQQTDAHGRALRAALTAIAESDEFAARRPELEAELNGAEIAARHRTPVLKGTAVQVTPMEAARMYFTFAQEQLGRAMGSEFAGSMALHGLGKLYTALAEQESLHTRSAESKAMTFFQAALLVEPKNYMAANDLGVLLARAGYYAEARAALEHSVAVVPQADGWHNLAEVCRRLGDAERAAQAARAAQWCQRAAEQRLSPGGRVKWVDPPMFAQTFAQTPSAYQPLPARQPAATKAEQPVAQKPFGSLFEKR